MHICCAPCLIYPLECLRQKRAEAKGLFYNPNIYPLIEYERRRETLDCYSRQEGFEVTYADYAPADFFKLRFDSGRCSLCWGLRLSKAAQLARKEGFDAFSTTLLASPYQDHKLLKGIGESVAEKEGVDFYYEDFRPGFRGAQEEAKRRGLYRQKYCGCVYSQVERCKRQVKYW